VSLDKVGLSMAIPPHTQWVDRQSDMVNLAIFDKNGKMAANLLIFKMNDGRALMSPDQESMVAGGTAGFYVMNTFGAKATFMPDRTVKLANGVEAISLSSKTTINGGQVEFWYISIQTPKQGAALMFIGPEAYFANQAALDAFLATVELTAK